MPDQRGRTELLLYVCTRNHGENGTTGAAPDVLSFSVVGLVGVGDERRWYPDGDCAWSTECENTSARDVMLGTRRRRSLQADSRPYNERGGVEEGKCTRTASLARGAGLGEGS